MFNFILKLRGRVGHTLIFLFVTLTSTPAFAAMPWESPLSQLRDSFEGPTARLVTVLAIIASGGALCVGESGSLFRRCAGVVFGASLMIGASSLASTIWG